jgi:amidase
MTELHELTALEQAAAIRTGAVSPVEITQHHLDRAERLGPGVGAFITLTPERAMAQAHAAEQAVRAALRDGAQAGLPALLGVPVPIKDLNNVAGVRATYGSAAYAAFVPAVDDHVVTRLRAAGTIMIGKTNTPEFGSPCYTENWLAPPARTPWDLARSAGGSSGGAAAAVAAGLAPVAHASDGGGSIRIPASVCGLVGLKPSRGRISVGPVKGDVSGLGTDGPLGRSVRDVAALLDAMAGAMPGDPQWAPPLPPGETFLAAAGREPGRLRIGRFARPVIAATTVDPACLEAYEQTSALLAELGHEVEDVDPPFGVEVVPTFEAVWCVLSTLTPVPPQAQELLTPLTRHLRGRGRAVTGTGYAQALAGMQAASRAALTRLAAYDALLSPTLAHLPARVGELRDDADPAADFEAQKRYTPFTATYNVTGQPAISLPLHWAAQPGGAVLPVGVMLAGRPTGEAQLLALAAQLEAARPWAARRPPAAVAHSPS